MELALAAGFTHGFPRRADKIVPPQLPSRDQTRGSRQSEREDHLRHTGTRFHHLQPLPEASTWRCCLPCCTAYCEGSPAGAFSSSRRDKRYCTVAVPLRLEVERECQECSVQHVDQCEKRSCRIKIQIFLCNAVSAWQALALPNGDVVELCWRRGRTRPGFTAGARISAYGVAARRASAGGDGRSALSFMTASRTVTFLSPRACQSWLRITRRR